MTRTLLAATALTATLLVPQPASAGTTSTYAGGCYYAGSIVAGPSWAGVIASATVVYSEATPPDNPVTATVTCEIRVDGGAVVAVPFSGSGVVAGGARTSFGATDDDVVQICETVDYVTDATPTTTACETLWPLVPREVTDLVYGIVDSICSVSCHFWWEPLVCANLATLYPGVPGVVDIGQDGDVTGWGMEVYDCPPYGWRAAT